MRQVLFDIDGTLLRTNGAGTRALTRALIEVCGFDEGMRGIAPDGKTDRQIVREALTVNGERPMLDDAGLKRFFDVYEGHLEREMETDGGMLVYCGAYRLACRLAADERFHVGVATGNIRRCAWLKLQHAGLEGLFRFGGYGCDAEDRYNMIRAAIERGSSDRRPPSDVVVIGDTPNDVLHGRKAGARTVGVATGNYSREALEDVGADLAVSSLDPDARLMAFMQA